MGAEESQTCEHRTVFVVGRFPVCKLLGGLGWNGFDSFDGPDGRVKFRGIDFLKLFA